MATLARTWARELCSGALLGTVLLSSCSSDLPPPTAPLGPAVDSAAVTANIHNVLSAVVGVRVNHAESVRAEYRVRGSSSSGGVSAAVVPTQGIATVAVLGLLPATEYAFVAVAYAIGGRAESDTLLLTTGPLPADLPSYSASGPNPHPGFVAFAAGQYGLVIDNTGRVVWYRRFPNGSGLAFTAQPNGGWFARPPTPHAGDIEPWIELDPLGNISRTLSCADGLQPRPHDLIAQPSGDFWILCDETRTMDLSPIGGMPDARVTGTVVQHLDPSGALLFAWSAFDHFALVDLHPSQRAGPFVNWTHGNAIEIDAEGNLLVSFRNLNEITKIDASTGAVVWRLGGLRNQFAMPAGTPSFAGQHSVRAVVPDRVVILDNVGDSLESRVEQWQIDDTGGIASLSWSAGAVPQARTLIGGSVQPLTRGRILVSYGTSGRVEEYDSLGAVQWRIQGNPGYVFRAQRIQSLYAPGVGTPR